MKFWTCHGSFVVVVCVKLSSEIISCNCVTLKIVSIEFELRWKNRSWNAELHCDLPFHQWQTSLSMVSCSIWRFASSQHQPPRGVPVGTTIVATRVSSYKSGTSDTNLTPFHEIPFPQTKIATTSQAIYSRILIEWKHLGPLWFTWINFKFYHDMQINWPDSGSPPIRLSDS